MEKIWVALSEYRFWDVSIQNREWVKGYEIYYKENLDSEVIFK